MTELRRSCALGLILALQPPAAARAQDEASPEGRALATVLFKQARELLAAGKIPDACRKFEESQRLDPGGGTLLNLALCHEHEGWLARSWAEFNEAAAVARRDGRVDRETVAQQHARALEPRLSTLSIIVPPGSQVPGLRVECDGREIGPAAWALAMPVDGGKHIVHATAPGKVPFHLDLVMAPEAERRSVEIPVLPTPVVIVPHTSAASRDSSPYSPGLRWAGIVAAGAGVVALGVSGVELWRALDAKSDAEPHCPDYCDEIGRRLSGAAVARGNVATAFGIGGAALLIGGTALYLVGGGSRTSEESSVAARLTLLASQGGVGAVLVGSY